MTGPAIEDAARAWDGTVVRLIAARENHVYEMRLPGGDRAALRLHRPGYQSAESIAAELKWTSALAEKGFRCPRPIAALDGQMMVETDQGIVTVVSWVDAAPIARLADQGADLGPVFQRLGGLLAELHQLSDDGAFDGITDRPDWGLDALTSETPHWGRFWENPALTDTESDHLFAARGIMRNWLLDQRFDTGAIHADAISENVMGDADEMWLIDFDDSGTGYRLFDLGVPLVQFWERDDLADLVSNIALGYAGVIGAEPDRIATAIPRFMAMRAIASAGWIISRKAKDDPLQRLYAERALACARRFIL